MKKLHWTNSLLCEHFTIQTSFQRCWKVFFYQFLNICSNVKIFPIFHILPTTNQICAEKCEDCAGGEEVVLCRSVDGDQVGGDQVDGDDHDDDGDGDDDHHYYHEAVADDIVKGRVG